MGCGIGGTSRYLAREHGCKVTGITISGKQVEMATRLTKDQPLPNPNSNSNRNHDHGTADFIELDAEKMGDHWPKQPNFDCVWISEALSHLPDKQLFFQNAFRVLGSNGKLVMADWFKAEYLTDTQIEADIKPIQGMSPLSACRCDWLTGEDGMFLPPLCTQSDYVRLAKDAGFQTFSEPLDISGEVAKTW